MNTITAKAVLAHINIALEKYTEQGSRPFLDSNNRYVNVPVIVHKEPHIEAEVVFIAGYHPIGSQSHIWRNSDECWNSLTGDEEITKQAGAAAISAIIETLLKPEERGITLHCRVQRIDGTLFWLNPELNKMTVWIDTSTDQAFSQCTTIVVSFLNARDMSRLTASLPEDQREEHAKKNMILPLSLLLENSNFQAAVYLIYKNVFEQLIEEKAKGFEAADINDLTSSFVSTYQEIIQATKRDS
jgi:hypothetical protein